VSVYTTDGVLIDNWPAGHRPAGLCVRDGLVYVAEQQARMEFAGYQNCESIACQTLSATAPATPSCVDYALRAVPC
jgi:hypothetical protein